MKTATKKIFLLNAIFFGFAFGLFSLLMIPAAVDFLSGLKAILFLFVWVGLMWLGGSSYEAWRKSKLNNDLE